MTEFQRQLLSWVQIAIATNDVRNAVAQIRQNSPRHQRTHSPAAGVCWWSDHDHAPVSERRTVEDLSNLVDETISRALLSVKGVAQTGVSAVLIVKSGRHHDPPVASLGITATR